MTEVTSRLKASRPTSLFKALLLTGALAFASSAGGAQGTGASVTTSSTTPGQPTFAPRVAGQLFSQPHGPGSGHGSPMGSDSPMGMSADTVERHFIEQMIPHHDDAVIMADLALAQAEHAELRQFAATIKRVQTEEILRMRQWYRDWFGSEPAAADMGSAGHGMGQSMAMGHDMGTGHGMGMGHTMGMGHGMAGHDASSIDGAVPFDKAFIEDMIPHHQMAVMMSTMALRHVDRPELQELLRSIVESQSAEIAQMRSWYQAWYGTTLPTMGAPASSAPAMGAPGTPGARIRGLAAEEVRQIRAGQGAGLARAAEVNGLPGPRHVLDLAAELGLSPEQRAQIQAIFAAMQDEATRVGQRYLDAQQSFEHGRRDPAQRGLALGARHTEMTELRGELERVHLRAHLTTAELLTESQIATYNSRRGYESAD